MIDVHISFRHKGFQAKEPGAATTRAPGFLLPPHRAGSPSPKHAGGHKVYASPIAPRFACPLMTDSLDTAPRLTSKQRARLRSLAHDLDPVVRVGKDGLTDAVIDAAEEAFNTRELLKARVLDAAMEDARDVAHALADRLDGVRVVQVIGHVAILYRPHPDDPQIELP